MKQKTISVLLLFILIILSSSFVLAEQFDYETSFTFTNPAPVTSQYVYTGSEHYFLTARDDYPLSSNGLYRYNETNGTYDYCNQPTSNDVDYLAYDSVTDGLFFGNEIAQRLYRVETGTDFCNGTYFGTTANINVETICSFPTGNNLNGVYANDGYLYIYSGGASQDMLCVLDSTTYSHIQTHNITESEVEYSTMRFIDGDALNNDRMNVISGGVVYIYSISDTITINSLVDSYFPTSIQGSRGSFVNTTGLYNWNGVGTIYKHTYDGVQNETNFPYQEYNGVYYSTSQCFRQPTFCLGDESFYLCDGGTIFNQRNDCFNTYGFSYRMETACSDASFIDHCVSGCATKTAYDEDNEITYVYGECLPQDCQNECTAKGWECVSGNARKYCDDDYDTDRCLEYGSVAYCNEGEFCSQGECVEFNFSRSGNSLNIPAFNLLYESEDTITIDDVLGNKEGTDYTLDVFTPNRLDVRTTNPFHIQRLGYEPLTSSTDWFYVSMDCDYEEQSRLLEDFQEGNISLSVFNWTGNPVVFDRGVNDYWLYFSSGGTTATAEYQQEKENNIIRFDVDFANPYDDKVEIEIYNEDYDSIAHFYMHDAQLDETVIEVYEINATDNPADLIYNITGVNALERISVEIVIDHVNDIYTIYSYVQRENGEVSKYYSVPLPFTDEVTSNSFIKFTRNSGYFFIDNFEVSGVDVFEVYNEEPQLQKTTVCQLDEGCSNLRMYLNVENTPVYHVYEDLEVCVTLEDELLTEADLQNLNRNEKFIFTIGILFVILIFFTIVGYASESMKVGLLAGTLVGVGWLITAVVIGWIPAWIIILMIILASFVVARSIANLGG